MTEKRRIRVRAEKGQSMVEFAIVLPVLLLVVLGIMQFGVVYNNWVTLTDATRAGARQAAVSRGLSDPNGTTVSKTKTSASNLDQTKLTVTVIPANAGWVQGADATVTATYPYDINIMGVVVASGNLSSSTTERIE